MRKLSVVKVFLVLAVSAGFNPLLPVKLDNVKVPKAVKKVTEEVPKPTAEVTRFIIKSITFRDITFEFEIEVNNPYPVELKLDGVAMKFLIEGNQLFDAVSSKGFAIAPKKKRANVFTSTLKYVDIIKIVKSFQEKDLLDCAVDTTIIIPLPKYQGLPPSISFNYVLKKKIPAIEPEVNIKNFQVKLPSEKEIADSIQKTAVKNVSPKNIYNQFSSMVSGKKTEPVINPRDIDVKFTVTFDIEIRNKAKSLLQLAPLGFSFYVEENKLVDGSTKEVQTSAQTTKVTVSNVFSSKNLTQAVIDTFQKGKGSFRVEGGTGLIVPKDLSQEPIPLNFNESGSFNLR